MKRKMANYTLRVFALLFAAALTVNVWANSVIKAEVSPSFSGANADITVHNDYYGNTLIEISVRGLKPNSVYTAWFVNMKPKMTMTGVGKSPYAFTTDYQGNATYTAKIKTSQISKWQMLKVVMHKDGNPKNMNKANRVGAFMTSTSNIVSGSESMAPEASSY